ncbi:MAG: sugar transferase [Desulfovibrionaceae bacterium]
MYQQQVQIVITFLILLDGLLVIVCGYAAEYIKWVQSGYLNDLDQVLLTGIILFLMFVNTFAMGRAGFYSSHKPGGAAGCAARLLAVVAVDFSLLLIGLYSLRIFGLSRLFFLVYAALLFISLGLVRLAASMYIWRKVAKGFNARQVLLVGSDLRAAKVLEALERQLSWGHRVAGYLRPKADSEDTMTGPQLLGTMDEFEQVLHRHSVDEVVFVLPRDGKLAEPIELCEALGVSYRLVPSMWNPDDTLPITVERIQNIPTLSRAPVRISAEGRLAKALLDLVGGLVGTAILCLMLPFVALAIKLDSPGPVFFGQPRVGLNRRVFHCLKFRTMYVDAEARKKELMEANIMDGRMFKVENDPRVTRVGRFLRKTSLDEFPQFINVLRGEMSLVGTRPPTLDEVALYEDWQQRRISMKPGITGLWQISGRNKITEFDEVVKLDLRYIDNWRFLDDLVIIWKTIIVVLRRKGAL